MKFSEILTNINQETNGNHLHQIKLSRWVQQIILSQLTSSSIKIKNSRQEFAVSNFFAGKMAYWKMEPDSRKTYSFFELHMFFKKVYFSLYELHLQFRLQGYIQDFKMTCSKIQQKVVSWRSSGHLEQ